MVAKRHERTPARRMAVQMLYTSEIHGVAPSKLLAEGSCMSFGSEDDADETLSDYALAMIQGVEDHQADIDHRLEAISDNWAISRMPIVDRSILRLATYEMIYVDDVPISVSINEAVELAKTFGGEDESPRFVNGILGRIAISLEEAEEAESVEDQSAEAGSESKQASADRATQR